MIKHILCTKNTVVRPLSSSPPPTRLGEDGVRQRHAPGAAVEDVLSRGGCLKRCDGVEDAIWETWVEDVEVG